MFKKKLLAFLFLPLFSLLVMPSKNVSSFFAIDNQTRNIDYKEPLKNPGATYETQRVWLSFNLTTDVSFDPAVSYTKGDSYEIVKMEKTPNGYDSKNYYYADIPYTENSMHFLGIFENSTVLYDKFIPAISYGSCYFTGSSETDFENITTGVVEGADYVILGLVVEAYLTYGKADSNGSTKQTITNLESTWFNKASATKEELKQNKIKDYTGYASNGNSYEGLTKTSDFSINEKWNTMKSQAGIRTKTNFFTNFFGSNAFIFVVVGASTLVVVGLVITLMVIQKKKKQKELQ